MRLVEPPERPLAMCCAGWFPELPPLWPERVAIAIDRERRPVSSSPRVGRATRCWGQQR